MPIGAVQQPPTILERTVDFVRHRPVVELALGELLEIEARLAHRLTLGVARPADARRLDSVAAEIDRRWAIALRD